VTITYSIENFNVPSKGYVQIDIDNSLFYLSDNNSVYTIAGLTSGTHTVRAALLDLNKNEITSENSSSSISFKTTISTADEPTILITSPAINSVLDSGGYTDILFSIVNFSVPEDGGIVFEVTANGQVSKSFKTSDAAFSVNIDNTGSYVVKATLARDINTLLSNTMSTASVIFSVGASARAQGSSRTLITEETTATRAVSTEGGSIGLEEITAGDTQFSNTAIGNFWVVKSNSSSGINGDCTIVVEGVVGSDLINSNLKICGDHSFVYVTFSQSVENNQFKNGKIIVPYGEFNTGKEYNILGNTQDKIEIEEIIYPDGMQGQEQYAIGSSSTSSSEVSGSVVVEEEKLGDIIKGQRLLLLPKEDKTKLYCNFGDLLAPNELVGAKIRFSSNNAYYDEEGTMVVDANNTNQYTILENTPVSITISPKPPPLFVRERDSVVFTTTKFYPCMSFNYTMTTNESDHSHSTTLIGKIMSGKISSYTFTSPYTVEIYVYDTDDLKNVIFAENPYLLNGEKIYFYDPLNTYLEYEETVLYVTSKKIVLSVTGSSNWNTSGTTPQKISSGFSWAIDARFHGKTSTPSYEDFVSIRKNLATTAIIGIDQVVVENTAEMSIGDEIGIIDNNLIEQRTSILNIPDSTTIQLTSVLEREYSVGRSAIVKVYRDTFSEDQHYHYITNLEIDTQSSDAYASLGYPKDHSHRVTNYIDNVSSLKYKGKQGQLIACGNSHDVYKTTDDGASWEKLVDIYDYHNVADGKTAATVVATNYSEDLYVGTNQGFLLAQAENLSDEVPLEYPFTDEYLPSSSSESSLSEESISSSDSSITVSTTSSSMIMGTSSSLTISTSTSFAEELTSSTSSLSTSISTGGLLTDIIGWWKMNEFRWVGTFEEVRDDSGFNQHGIVVGNADIANDPERGLCGEFSLPQGYVEIRNSVAFNFGDDDFSISLWTRDEKAHCAILSKENWSGKNNGIMIFADLTGQIRYFNGRVDDVLSFGEISSDWKYLTLVKRENQVFLYNNTILVSAGYENRILNNDLKMRFANSSDGTHNYSGKIDDVRIYNRALDEAEIKDLYRKS